ncbi:Alpha/Beta hydrolase protein [Tricladium varicosporioides]|nr:Alpha/Beta hydrolase protein [Hymenoscyphus varicosporioides]
MFVPVTINAKNIDLSKVPAPSTPLSPGFVVPYTIPVTSTYNISIRYCEPVFNEDRENTLQFLVHGLTYTKDYWFAPDTGNQLANTRYSWVDYASYQGYYSVAIDRVGNGLSSHPDPNTEAQYPANVEVAHELIKLFRSNSSPLPHTFNKIIYAGHSFGSIVGNNLVAKYPKDVDGLVLTGYSNYVIPAAPPEVLNNILPAAFASPTRFSNLPTGYLQFNSRPGQALFFFHAPFYNTDVFNHDYDTRGTLTAGELASTPFALNTASNYLGPVLAIIGQNDQIFCDPATDCGSVINGPLADTKSLFPAANSYEASIVATAGHCWHLHYSAPQGFGVAHNWMARRGF